MRRICDRNVFIGLFVTLLLSCLWGCSDDPLDSGEKLRAGQLTVSEARELYEQYASMMSSRSMATGEVVGDLDPGILTVTWENAELSTTRVNSFVSVPIGTTNNSWVLSPSNEDWVGVSQKLVIVQEDATRRRNVYLLSVIPEGDYAAKHKDDLSRIYNAEQMPDDFSGLVVYTKIQGGIPVHVGSYVEGQMVEDVFLFDKNYSPEENLERLNAVLDGYSVQTNDIMLSRSESSGGGGGSFDNWNFDNVGGDSFIQDGFTCWNYTDSSGRDFVLADTDGDGRPDTVLGSSADVDSGGNKPDEPMNPFDPNIPDAPSTDKGDVNPHQGTGGGASGGSTPKPEPPTGPRIDTTGMSKNLQAMIDNALQALKKIGVSNKVLDNLIIKTGVLPEGISAMIIHDGTLLEEIFGTVKLTVILGRNYEMSEDMFSLVVGHEFYHLYLFGISRDAGSARELASVNQELLDLINSNIQGNKLDINKAHHEYMGNKNRQYEAFLRSAFPGKNVDYYNYGKWGGTLTDTEAFEKLPEREQIEIRDYIQNNKLE